MNSAIPVQQESPATPIEGMRGFKGKRDRRGLICLLLLFAVAGILDVMVALSMSRTADEPDYVSYGVQILHARPDRSGYLLWNSKTPISALNAIPRVVALHLQPHASLQKVAGILRELQVARLPSVLSLLLLNWFVYCWAYELYGMSAALACAAMVVLSPNLIAHGTLATNDGYFALGVVASLYYFRRYLLKPSLRNAGVSALVLALAQLAKPFAFYLYAVVGGFVILGLIRAPLGGIRLRRNQVIAYLALLVACFLAVLNLGYAFRGTMASLGSYQFQSASFKGLQRLPLASSLPVPVPRAFLQGLDMMKYCDDAGLTYGNIYMLGELQRIHDPAFHKFKSYYLVAWFFKEPIALQILFVIGLFVVLRKRAWKDFAVGEGPLLTAAITLVLWQSLLRNSQIGIRNILPALAVEIIIAGAAFASFSQLSKRKQAGLMLLIGWLTVSTLSYYPQMIPYMNEWVVDRKMSYKLLADSNIDWGQNTKLVDEFLSKNPDVKLNPDEPSTGRVLVSVNRLLGIDPRHAPMSWLAQSRPVAHVGYAHLLYIVPQK
jgi:hypothetical protein